MSAANSLSSSLPAPRCLISMYLLLLCYRPASAHFTVVSDSLNWTPFLLKVFFILSIARRFKSRRYADHQLDRELEVIVVKKDCDVELYQKHATFSSETYKRVDYENAREPTWCISLNGGPSSPRIVSSPLKQVRLLQS